MSYLTLKTLFAAFFALIISAGQVCACTPGFAAIDDAATHQAEAAHHGVAHHGNVQQHKKHGHETPAGGCEHCKQPPYLKASANSDLSVSLSAPSFQKFISLDEMVQPFSKAYALMVIKYIALHDPPGRTLVSLKIKLLN